jgi:hypothetical protein
MKKTNTYKKKHAPATTPTMSQPWSGKIAVLVLGPRMCPNKPAGPTTETSVVLIGLTKPSTSYVIKTDMKKTETGTSYKKNCNCVSSETTLSKSLLRPFACSDRWRPTEEDEISENINKPSSKTVVAMPNMTPTKTRQNTNTRSRTAKMTKHEIPKYNFRKHNANPMKAMS